MNPTNPYDTIQQLRQRVQELTAERDKVTQYWQIAEGRCDAMMKQRDELEAVLREIRSVAPREVECHNMHHAKKDQHEFDETCPVVSRYAEAIAKIDMVLK